MHNQNRSDHPETEPGSQVSQALSTAANLALLVFFAFTWPVVGDEVRLQNGDRYLGQVLTLDNQTLVLQSEVLGTVRVPRSKVAQIALGTAGFGTNAALPISLATTTNASKNGAADTVSSLASLGADSNVVRQIQAQLLGAGGAEANAKFKEMFGGYLSGKLSVSDIRAQAQAATEQLKELKGELGDEAGGMLDGYLSILEKFLDEAKPAGSSAGATNALGATKAKPGANLR
jgi:hypothetical protein